MRRAKIFLLLLGILGLCGCRSYTDEAVLKQNIGALLEKYQRGVNDMNKGLLESVISDKFSFYNTDRARYIEGLLSMTMLIDKMTYGNIRVEDYKILADVQTDGSIIFKPEVQMPLFKSVPFMQGKLRTRSVFAFLYEAEADLKILTEDQILTEKEIFWGARPPGIIQPVLSAYHVAPGDQVEVRFWVNKSNNDVLFVFVNEQMLGGYALGDLDGEMANYTVKVPAALQRGDNFEIKLLAFAGQVDLNNPDEAVLQGAAVRTFVLPVR
ncbi:hypothetical protein NO1_1577 [Candidatus Termititenax aidoneus]|uniref:Uncharacterized protein n=1 Tax=Termititenax aidoneus TaxID=2218524 RepID=A0A388TC28_TERA1|nr:hypothetical protein NO1_1577 [Candidatus Termititenax aidoneus]